MAQQYLYRIVTPEGKEKKGSIEADDKNKAINQLKAAGNTVVSMEAANALNKDFNFTIGKKKLKPRELGIFCRQFVSIMKAGINIVTALGMLSEQTENKILKEALKNVQNSVEKGDTLANSLRKEGTLFPNLMINMIEAGEASGSLETSLDRMSTHFEKDARMKGLVKKAMMYPMVLLVVMVIVIIVMLVVVIPNFQDMFDQIGSELPAYTQMIVNLSKTLQEDWLIILAVFLVIVFAIRYFKKTDTGEHFFGKLKIKLPIFGKLNVKSECARFSRTLSTLIATGMPMIDALEITARTMDNVLYKDAIYDAKKQVERGIPLSRPLKQSGLFPAMIIHMLSIGEETGNLEEMLGNVSKYYDEEVELTTQQVTAMMEPMIIVVMALVVGALIMAIYSPMMKLYSDIG